MNEGYIGKKLKTIFVAGILGAILFVSIYGIRILDVSYDDWLLTGGDFSQHYFGWLYYRKSPWQVPIGTIVGLSDANPSIIFTDSIPVFAIFFKFFEFLLPETFQYFGIWGICSFIIMSIFASLIIGKFTEDLFIVWLGSVFFTLSPYVLARMYTHTSLGGQWIILASILIWINDYGKEKFYKKVSIWSGTLCLASLIHIYYIPITVIFLLADVIRWGIIKKNILKSILIFSFPIIITIGVLLLVGAFSSGGNIDSDGLGYYSANLNCFINPTLNMSKFVKEQPCGGGQIFEGLGYLGLGMILLCCINLAYCMSCSLTDLENYWKKYKLFIVLYCAILISFLVLALSPTVMFGDHILVKIDWPEPIMKLLGIFRSSGRFIWPVCYLIFIGNIYFISKNKWENNRAFLKILIFCLVIQLVDLSPYILQRKQTVSSPQGLSDNKLTIDAWNILLENKKKIIFKPWDMVYDVSEEVFQIGRLTYDNNIQFNSFYISRPNKDVMDFQELKYMSNSNFEKDFVYIFGGIDEILDENYDLNYYFVDNILIGLKNDIIALNDFATVQKIDSTKPFLIKMSDMKLYYNENTRINKENLEIMPEDLMYGPYYDLNQGKYKVEVFGKNLKNASWNISSYNKNQNFDYKISEQSNNKISIEFELKEQVNDVEIKAFNEGEQSILVDCMLISMYK